MAARVFRRGEPAFRLDQGVVVVASPDAPGLVGRTGRIASPHPPADGRWEVEGLRDLDYDLAFGHPTFTADQLRTP